MSKHGYFSSTIGQKQILGLMGLLFTGFTLGHMLGNLLIFAGPQVFNMYGHTITSNPLLPLVELGLVVIFLTHVLFAVRLTFKNKCARKQSYAVSANGEKGTSLIQRTMIHQGVVLFVFVVLHLITFKYGEHYAVVYNGLEVRDLYKLVAEKFRDPLYVVFYFSCMVILGLHLGHGIQSAFKSLGFNHPMYEPKLKCLGRATAGLIAVGFISQPLYIYFFS